MVLKELSLSLLADDATEFLKKACPVFFKCRYIHLNPFSLVSKPAGHVVSLRLTAHPLDAAHDKHDIVLDANLRRIGAWATALQCLKDFREAFDR